MAIREGSCYNNSKKLVKRVRVIKYCGYYGKKGHNSRIYIIEIKDIDNSDTSKK